MIDLIGTVIVPTVQAFKQGMAGVAARDRLGVLNMGPRAKVDLSTL